MGGKRHLDAHLRFFATDLLFTGRMLSYSRALRWQDRGRVTKSAANLAPEMPTEFKTSFPSLFSFGAGRHLSHWIR